MFPRNRLRLRALTIGYSVDADGTVQSLVVAIKSKGKWRFAGSVSSGITPELAENLKAQAESIHREKPFVANTFSAIWIEPVVHCNIEAEYSEVEDNFSKINLIGLN